MRVSRITDLIYSFRLLNIIKKSWIEQDAFKLGAIDHTGKTIIKWDDMNSEQRDSMSYFFKIAFNLKKAIEKIPGAESKLSRLVIGLRLLKEDNTKLDRPFTKEEIAFIIEELSKMMDEDTPVNVTGAAVSTNTPTKLNDKKKSVLTRKPLDKE